MGSISDYLENKLVDHILENTAYTPVATVYLGLSTADPLDSAAGLAEPTYTGYARKAITFGAASARAVAQSGDVTFDPCTAGSDTVTHWAIFDAAAAGNMLAHGSLSVSKTIIAGNTPSVASGQVTISVNAGAASTYCANKCLDFAFRNQAFAQPNCHIALATVAIVDADTGSTITEPVGNNYSRLDFGDWDAASAGASANTSIATMATPSGSWGTITAAGILDAAAAGNLLFYDNSLADQAVGADDTVRFPAGDFDVSFS